MIGIDYSAADVPVRADLQEAQRFVCDHLRSVGTWWTATERLAIAAAARAATRCALCRERKQALTTPAVNSAHTSSELLPPHLVEIVHRIRTDSARLSRAWFDSVLADGLAEEAYVELVAVVAQVAGLDSFCRALGIDPPTFPAPLPGTPSRRRPPSARSGMAWVPMIAPEDAAGPEADLYPPVPAIPAIIRALSLVPDELRAFCRTLAAGYVPVEQIIDPSARGPALDRLQIELVAARVSALNQCFHCATAHATLLRASSLVSEVAVNLAAINGEQVEATGVIHGAALVTFVEAAMGDDDAVLARERLALRAAISPAGLVDVAAVIGAFSAADRVADAIGLPVDPEIMMMSTEVRRELRLGRFATSASTPAYEEC